MKKKINSRAKGRRKELQAAKLLEAMGYQVQLAPNPTWWNRQVDLWGCWDVAGVSAEGFIFVQVKSSVGQTYGKALDKQRAFVAPLNAKKECWVFEDRVKGVKIIEL